MSRTLLLIVCCAACSPGGEGPSQRDTDSPPSLDTSDGPSFDTADSATAPSDTTVSASVRPVGNDILLATWVDVSTSAATTVSATWSDGEVGGNVSSDELATEHSLLLLGFRAGRTIDIEVVATQDGEPLAAVWTSLESDPLPDTFPELEVVAHDLARTEPGYLLFPIHGPTYAYLVALDEELQPAWIHEGFWADPRILDNGNLFGLREKEPMEMTFDGQVIRHYSSDPAAPSSAIFVDVGTMHHEIYPWPDDSFWMLSHTFREVPKYPVAYADPTQLGGPQVLMSDMVSVVGADGSLLQSIDVFDLLDPTRIGYDSLDGVQKDWAHANAVIPHPDGSFIVSLRHQDAMIKISTSGELEWILGDPAGWRGELVGKLLTPVGEPFQWPYHQHAPQWLSAIGDSEGRMLLFDNRNEGATPYTAKPPGQQYSGVVEYSIDESAKTVSMVGRYEDFGTTTPLASWAYGDADMMEETGNILAVFGMVEMELGIPGGESRRSRIIEFHPDDSTQPALDLRIHQSSRSWTMDRAEKIDPLR